MKFNFNLKGRGSAGAQYTLFKAGLPDDQADLLRSLLAASLSVGFTSVSTGAAETGAAFVFLRQTIRQTDREVLASIAIRLKEELNLRDFAFLLTAEMAAVYDDEGTARVVVRIIAEAGGLPAWLNHFFRAGSGRGRPGRHVRKQLSVLLNRLDEYHFTRYGAGVREGLKNALIGLQPRAAGRAQRQLFARIIRDQVPVRTNWEQEWHALYRLHYDSVEQRQVTLRDKWKEGISSFRIGYPALLDNLQPMLSAGVSGKVLKLAAEYLGNSAAAGVNGQSPLRLLKAWRGIQRGDQGGAGMLMEALERAAVHNSWNRSGFGRGAVSVIAMDVSNSMKRPVYGDDSVQRIDVGPLLAYSWKSRGENVITGIIGNTWRTTELPSRSILASTDQFRGHEGEAGFAVNARLIIRDLFWKKQVADKVLVFTDSPLWNNRTFDQSGGAELGRWWRGYRRQIAPRAKLYLFDLAGYGSKALEFLEDDVLLIAGWKDNLLQTLDALELSMGGSK